MDLFWWAKGTLNITFWLLLVFFFPAFFMQMRLRSSLKQQVRVRKEEQMASSFLIIFLFGRKKQGKFVSISINPEEMVSFRRKLYNETRPFLGNSIQSFAFSSA